MPAPFGKKNLPAGGRFLVMQVKYDFLSQRVNRTNLTGGHSNNTH